MEEIFGVFKTQFSQVYNRNKKYLLDITMNR